MAEHLHAALASEFHQHAIDAVSSAVERFGRIDVLVNNAGYGYQSTVEEGEESEIRAQFDTNVFGLFAMTRAVLPLMREQRKGNILNITSVAGLIGYPGSGYYAASKHAVEGYSESLTHEVREHGVRVLLVEPGPTNTPFDANMVQADSPLPVYAHQRRIFDEVVGAVYVPVAGRAPAEEELLAWSAERLSPARRPRRFTS